MIVRDRETHSISKREFTDQGYLRVPGKIARSGVQYYTARELDLTDRQPGEMVAVYRPPDEVFSDESLASYADVDTTMDHPHSFVSAESHKRHSVGHVTDRAKRVGDHVEAPIILKDKGAIARAEAGRVALSAGYKADLLPERGTTTDGEPYEFVQRNIRVNHIALVDNGRAGHEARLYDSDGTTECPIEKAYQAAQRAKSEAFNPHPGNANASAQGSTALPAAAYTPDYDTRGTEPAPDSAPTGSSNDPIQRAYERAMAKRQQAAKEDY